MNGTPRLATVAPDLVEELEGRSAAQLMAVSLAVVEWIERDDIVAEEIIAVAVDALRRGAVGDAESRSRILDVVEELDERAWSIQESMTESSSDGPYVIVFNQARAANAVWSALDPDPATAAMDAAYEAQAANGDLDGLRRVVLEALERSAQPNE